MSTKKKVSKKKASSKKSTATSKIFLAELAKDMRKVVAEMYTALNDEEILGLEPAFKNAKYMTLLRKADDIYLIAQQASKKKSK